MTLDDIAAVIKQSHRKRRHALGLQQIIDRKLESFIRINHTDWQPDLAEAERTKINRQVGKIIAEARKDSGDPELVYLVHANDASRGPWDKTRKDHESIMEKMAGDLPVFPFVESIRGAGALGLAIIVAEAGSLSLYANPARLWKRLGFAPYDGLAGSTWKRESWRTRALSKDEWIANPFSGERYALIHQIALALHKGQWVGERTDEATGEVTPAHPNGPYGEIYQKRRAHTAAAHQDWSKGHSYMDAIRVMMKAFLKDLWREWRIRQGHDVSDTQWQSALPSGGGPLVDDAQSIRAATDQQQSGHAGSDTQTSSAGSDAAGQLPVETQSGGARRVRKPTKKTMRAKAPRRRNGVDVRA